MVIDNCGTVTWVTPASDGGSPITGFEVICTSGGGIVVGPQTYPGTATGTGKDGFTGLLVGVPYNCTVVALNAVGAGPASAPSNEVVNAESADETAGVPMACQWFGATLQDFTLQTFTPAL